MIVLHRAASPARTQEMLEASGYASTAATPSPLHPDLQVPTVPTTPTTTANRAAGRSYGRLRRRGSALMPVRVRLPHDRRVETRGSTEDAGPAGEGYEYAPSRDGLAVSVQPHISFNEQNIAIPGLDLAYARKPNKTEKPMRHEWAATTLSLSEASRRPFRSRTQAWRYTNLTIPRARKDYKPSAYEHMDRGIEMANGYKQKLALCGAHRRLVWQVVIRNRVVKLRWLENAKWSALAVRGPWSI
ncbi:hypothetical protein EDC01DRAFT_636968 [Geopyxis carbonaria]|nr:hypothetical protein EDC01DRAFT_636968 [Geopyxis carbonaria]